MRYKIYTCGVADNFVTPHYGGYAWMSIDEDGVAEHGEGCTIRTTSNRVAMLSVVDAVKHLPDGSICEVYTNMQYLTYPLNNFKDYGRYEVNSDLICEFHAMLKEKNIECKVIWLKGGTDEILDEMRDLSLGQFLIVSDREMTDARRYKTDKQYHKEINEVIRTREQLPEYQKNGWI